MKTFKEFIEEAYLIEYRRNKTRPPQRSYNSEEDEEIIRHSTEHGLPAKPLLQQARTAPIQRINPSKLEASNTDLPDVRPGAKGRRKLRRQLKQYGRKPNDSIKRILKQRREGTLEPAVIHKDKQGNKTVVSGNTRLSVGKIYGFKVPTETIGHT